MAEFNVLVLPIDKVEPHPNADRLTINHIRGFICISNKTADGQDRYKAGDLVVYVPEGAVVPEELLKRNGYWDDTNDKGFLAGQKGDRVKAILLRGTLSQGIMFPTTTMENQIGRYVVNARNASRLVNAGDEVAEFLGIYKYIPPLPADMIGDAINLGIEYGVHYDVESVQMYPDMLTKVPYWDEVIQAWSTRVAECVYTEKMHGTLCAIGFDRTIDHAELFENRFFASSKHLMSLGQVFNNSDYNKQNNMYVKAAQEVWPKIKEYLTFMPAVEKITIFGEVFGPGVQDLHYGLKNKKFLAFDVRMQLMGEKPGYLGARKYELFRWMKLDHVPVLGWGPFDIDLMKTLSEQPSSMGGGIREGVVATDTSETLIGGRRPILKFVGKKYLLRRGGTEYN